VQQLQSAIEVERQKIRHHKGRVKHLASRMEKLDRHTQHRGIVRKGWKSIKGRLGL
jgi:flagellar biosynthesis chaperone FliJ